MEHNPPAVWGPVERMVRPGAEAPRWWHCDTHGAGTLNAWGCPDCVAELRRWKSTHAPRLAALEGLMHAAQHEAHAGREAVSTLASERAANALLTDEVERLRAAIARACAGYPADDAAPTCVAILRAALGPNAADEPRRSAASDSI